MPNPPAGGGVCLRIPLCVRFGAPVSGRRFRLPLFFVLHRDISVQTQAEGFWPPSLPPQYLHTVLLRIFRQILFLQILSILPGAPPSPRTIHLPPFERPPSLSVYLSFRVLSVSRQYRNNLRRHAFPCKLAILFRHFFQELIQIIFCYFNRFNRIRQHPSPRFQQC